MTTPLLIVTLLIDAAILVVSFRVIFLVHFWLSVAICNLVHWMANRHHTPGRHRPGRHSASTAPEDWTDGRPAFPRLES